jgi:NAD(P)-dependent dehydrogenase (short-subunit alcohol dehydrogenase family)
MRHGIDAYRRLPRVRYLSTNVTGFFLMTQRALELMGKQGHGHVVTITTSPVDQPMSSVPTALASLTKGALSAATKALAIEYAKTGIRVNAVSPEILKTRCINRKPIKPWRHSTQRAGWGMCPTS